MEALKYYQLKQQIKQNNFEPLYFFYGAEDFLQEECVAEIIKRVIPEADKMFSIDIAEGEELTADKFASIYQGLSFFSTHRVLLIKNTEEIRTAVADEIVVFLNTLPENTTIIFCTSKQKLPAKNGLMKELQKKAKCVVFWPLFPNAMEAWIKEYLRSKSLTIEDDAIRKLIAVSNENLRIIKSELEKVEVYLGSRKQIKIEDINLMQGQQKEYSIFDLGDMLYKKDIKKGLTCIDKLVNVRYNEVLMLNYLGKILKNMFFAKHLISEKSMTQEEIMQTLHMHAFYEKDFFKNLEKFKISEIERGIGLLTDAEYKIKTGMGTPSYILSNLWVNLCGRTAS